MDKPSEQAEPVDKASELSSDVFQSKDTTISEIPPLDGGTPDDSEESRSEKDAPQAEDGVRLAEEETKPQSVTESTSSPLPEDVKQLPPETGADVTSAPVDEQIPVVESNLPACDTPEESPVTESPAVTVEATEVPEIPLVDTLTPVDVEVTNSLLNPTDEKPDMVPVAVPDAPTEGRCSQEPATQPVAPVNGVPDESGRSSPLQVENVVENSTPSAVEVSPVPSADTAEGVLVDNPSENSRVEPVEVNGTEDKIDGSEANNCNVSDRSPEPALEGTPADDFGETDPVEPPNVAGESATATTTATGDTTSSSTSKSSTASTNEEMQDSPQPSGENLVTSSTAEVHADTASSHIESRDTSYDSLGDPLVPEATADVPKEILVATNAEVNETNLSAMGLDESGVLDSTADEPEMAPTDVQDIEGEREQGDGQESEEGSASGDEELDDDEDRRNPQYIPKRGAFYEHDDRVILTGEEPEKVPEAPIVIAKKVEPVEKPVKKSKKLWSDDGKWGHDLYNEEEQKPKSREEVVMTYGYDIRNEDCAPKARRRRKYGRGPNKYTRNWQDEDAYDKMKPRDRSKTRTPNEETSPRGQENSSQKQHNDHYRRSRPSNSFNGEEFPELPSKEYERRKYDRSSSHRDTNSNAWGRPKPGGERRPEKEIPKLHSPELEYKTEPMKVIEAIENKCKSSSEPLPPGKLEVVRTQTFENSRYTNRRGGSNEDSYNGKGKPKPKSSSLPNPVEMGRPIRKTSHLQEEPKPNYVSQKQEVGDKRGKPVAKARDEDHYEDMRSVKHMGGGDCERNYGNYPPNYPPEIKNSLQKSSLDKISRNTEGDTGQPRPKRYSSLRQQQQQRAMPENLSTSVGAQLPGNAQTMPPCSHQQQQQQQQQPPQPQPPPQPSHEPTQNQFFDAAPASPGFYNESQSPRSSFAYMPPSNPETQAQAAAAAAAAHPSRFLAQTISPRYLPQTGPDPQFLPPSVAPPTPPQTTPPHPVLPGPAASFLPTYPPGYPQFPPPPPAPQFHPLTASSQAPEIYRGGVTYYDTTSQQGPRQLPQRRPKNALPILPPPDVNERNLLGPESELNATQNKGFV